MSEGLVIRVVVYGIIFGVGLLQLPLLVDIAANLFPQWDIKRWSNRAVGAVLLTTCVAVAVGGYWVWITSVLPLWLRPTPVWSAAGAGHIAVGSWLWVLTMSNYVAAAVVPPGRAAAEADPRGNPPLVTTEPKADGEIATPRPPVSDDELLQRVRRPYFCRHCRAHRPADAFHCHDCGGCGAAVDHHCPFVNVCVGRDNYRFFVLFLLYGTVGMLYCAVITFPAFERCWIMSFALGEPRSEAQVAACSEHPEYTLIFLGPLGLGVALGNLLAVQVLLLLGDIRTVDALRYLRRTWNLRPILRRAAGCHGLARGSALRTLLVGPDAQWWHFVLPGRWVKARPAGGAKED